MRPNSSVEVNFDFANKQRLNGTTAQTSTALDVGRWYILCCDVAIRFHMSSDGTAVTAANGAPWSADRLEFKASNDSVRISIFAVDGAAAFDCTLLPSSPPIR